MVVGSRVYVMVTSADSCRTGENEGVEPVQLVCVGKFSWMGSESLLLTVLRCFGGEFTGKGE